MSITDWVEALQGPPDRARCGTEVDDNVDRATARVLGAVHQLLLVQVLAPLHYVDTA